MQRPLLLVGLALLAVAALTPGLEVMAPCVQTCAAEAQDSECTADPCCSCCVHVRSVEPGRAVPADPLAPSSAMAGAAAARLIAAAPGDILHVPKPASA